MRIATFFAVAFLSAAPAAFAATPVYLTLDHSSDLVLTPAAAQAVWREQLDDKLVKRLAKLYPVGRFGFISEVEGGFTGDKTCVVTARAILVPRSGKTLVFSPKKTATAFDAKPGASQAQCQDLAKAKLAEAIGSVVGALASN